jgi:hypothetical protein
MRISEMSTDRAADALITIAQPAGNIVKDPEIIAGLEALGAQNGGTMAAMLGEGLLPVLQLVLKNHRQDVYCIIAALTEKTVQEVAKQSILRTVADIRESWDADLASFFQSARPSSKGGKRTRSTTA